MSLDRLARSSPRPEHLATVMALEQRAGRVERRGNRWRIVPEAFAPEVLEAIALLDEVGGWSGKLAGSDVRMSDLFTLLKTPTGWRIIQKAFHWHA